MRIFGFWALFMVLGTTFMFIAFSSSKSSLADMVFPGCVDCVTMVAQNRKLKEKIYKPILEKSRDASNYNMEDYHPNDPVPSSKTTIKPKPIEHGTPLMPYIPKPTPPSHPTPDGPPSGYN